MVWNPPGSDDDKNKDKDIWTGRPKQSATDFEKIMRKLKAKYVLISKGNWGAQIPPFPVKSHSSRLLLSILILLITWILSGVFIVNPDEDAIILTFGRYTATVGSGLHWMAPFIQKRHIINSQKILTYTYSAQTLTKDMNMVSLKLLVRYRIANANDYLFNMKNPREGLKYATANAVTQVLGKFPLNGILGENREEAQQQIKTWLAGRLEQYRNGLLIKNVIFESITVPDETKAAFDDTIKAQEESKLLEDQARVYEANAISLNDSRAKRLMADAEVYKNQAILNAQLDVIPYLALLPEYLKAPAVMRERLYMETLESVLSHAKKIMVDTPAANTLYLPLDKWFKQPDAIKEVTPPLPPLTPAPIAPVTSIYPTKGGY